MAIWYKKSSLWTFIEEILEWNKPRGFKSELSYQRAHILWLEIFRFSRQFYCIIKLLVWAPVNVGAEWSAPILVADLHRELLLEYKQSTIGLEGKLGTSVQQCLLPSLLHDMEHAMLTLPYSWRITMSLLTAQIVM